MCGGFIGKSRLLVSRSSSGSVEEEANHEENSQFKFTMNSIRVHSSIDIVMNVRSGVLREMGLIVIVIMRNEVVVGREEASIHHSSISQIFAIHSSCNNEKSK